MDTVPEQAERFCKTRWQRDESRPSIFLEGEEIRWTIDLCPSCGYDAPNGEWPHGHTVHCECGLFILCFGLGLNIWRSDTISEKIKNRALQGLGKLLN